MAEEKAPEKEPEAPHIHIRGEGGAIHKLDLPVHEAILERMAKGYIARVNEDGTSYVADDDPTRPALSAVKADWVGWAVHNGMSPDDAEAATKDDLIGKFGTDN